MITRNATRRLLPLCLIGALVVALAAACGKASTGTKTPTPTSPSASATTSTGSTPPNGSPTTSTSGSATPAGAVPQADQIAAEQTLITYYTALNNQDYPAAYALWADDGAASQQTAAQFASGYAHTVRIEAQFDNAVPSSNGVAIGAAILSVVNTPSSPAPGQAVEQYTGVYQLKLQAGVWRISGGDIQRGPDATKAPAELADSTTALQSYYSALNAQQYAKAFTYWSNEGQANGNSFTQFANGYATTKSIDAHFGTPVLGGAAGSIFATVPAVVISTLRDGTQQAFCGVYTMRKLNVRPFQLFGWHIDSAHINPLSAVPAATTIPALLTNGC